MVRVLNIVNIWPKVKIDYSTYILIFLALLAGYIKNITIILIIVFIHELGHVFFFKLFNIEIEKIIIYPFGGITYINSKIHERIYKSILMSLGGILFQLILGIVINYLYKNGLLINSTYKLFNLYNKNIILFNLIPIIPLDGSKIVLSILSKFLAFQVSYILMIIIGSISLFSFILYKMFFKLNDLVLNIYLIIKLIEVIKEYKLVKKKFYLERIIYDNYYNKIISGKINLDYMRIDKYYYFWDSNKYVNEKDYLKKSYYKGNF